MNNERKPVESYREERHDYDSAAVPMLPEPGVMWVPICGGRPYAVDFVCPCGCGASCFTAWKIVLPSVILKCAKQPDVKRIDGVNVGPLAP